jgi:hypothetical protein
MQARVSEARQQLAASHRAAVAQRVPQLLERGAFGIERQGMVGPCSTDAPQASACGMTAFRHHERNAPQVSPEQALARVLNTIPDLCASADDTYSLASALVAKGVRAIAPDQLAYARKYPRIPAWDILPELLPTGRS